jgi:cobalt-zinc-cadmium efflux system membrane fusion protein
MQVLIRIIAQTSACLALVALLAAPLGCGGGNHAEHAGEAHGSGGHDAHSEGRAETLALAPEQRVAAGIEVAPVGPGSIDSGVELLGEVLPNGDRLAHIVPRFAGIVRDVRKNAGDAVRSGDVLAVIESSDSLAPYEIRTLIDGIVLAKHLTRGEAVDREQQAFVVADLSTVWVDLSVYQRDLARIAVGQRVRIRAASDGPDAEGTISYLTPALDRVTRTATARVVLDNPGRKFLPGMLVSARTLDTAEAALAVPRDAVQSLDGRPSVFVETPEGFAAREITLGREGESRAEVLSGLAPGERIAVTNTFLLKAELARAEAEHEH